MTKPQYIALTYPCYFAFETAQPCYAYLTKDTQYSIVLTVNAGYE